MVDDRIVPPPLAPELADLLTTTERDVLRAIVRDGDIVDGFRARLLGAAHGQPDDDEGEGDAWLLVRLSPALMDALAAFEADAADLEAEPDLELDHDGEPSLGATNDLNQERAWRAPEVCGIDLEFDGDGVPDADLEPNMGALFCCDLRMPQTLWASCPGPDELEEENEHAETAGLGDGCVDLEPMLGATEDIDHRNAWRGRDSWQFVEDGEMTGTEDDLPKPERPGVTFEQSQAEDAADRAAVREAVGRLGELTGRRAAIGSHGQVRWYEDSEVRTVNGLRIVGVVR